MENNVQELNIKLRNLKLNDYLELQESMLKAYPDMPNATWKKQHIETLLKLFPKGQLCIAVNDKVVAVALSIIVDYKLFGDNHTYAQITGNYTFSTHTNTGDTLYGIEIFVHPQYRNLRLGSRLYEARQDLCENLNLKHIMVGGRLPNYSKHSDKMTPKTYIEKVKRKEIFDPVLGFQLAYDFQVRKVLADYLPGDSSSKEFAALMAWRNIYYEAEEELINQKKSVVRLGLVQWQMRTTKSLEEFFDQAEFFIDVLGGYNCDFALFPELFNTPLMAPYNHLDEPTAIRKLAKYTDTIVSKFKEMAVGYNINIITGSMPVIERGKLYNIAYLCRRDGSTDFIKKIHITPNERNTWGMVGGDELRVFDTDCGKIGILICYDVEFPELPRLLADEGMNILFVPFLTDTQNGYNRVRICAQARAVENECYVAIAGCVGNLPKVNNMDIQFAQAAVFTPSDFAFPTNAIKAEATPNTEMTLIADVDLDLLRELHVFGSVRNLQDRRKDAYNLEWIGKKK
ncbi:MAG: GNAT family N-acetyltransferase [Luteibaculaceae bacterium]